jgi:basic amino acid/polyamine antiporter, APA family
VTEAVPGLRRVLGVWAAMAVVVGTVIGSGIFLVTQDMIKAVGSPAMVFVVWAVGGVLTLFGALTYAELAAAMPEAGGEYVYLREAYGPFFGFLYGWSQTLVAKSASLATLATGFYLYLENFIPSFRAVFLTIPLPIGPGGAPLEVRRGQLFAMALILALGWLNYFGVKLSGNVQVAVTVAKVALILGVIAVGLFGGRADASNLGSSVPAAGGVSGFFGALLSALWAYDGWNNVNMVAGEVRRPQRNLPLALIGGVLVVAGLYLATNLAYFLVLSSPQVGASNRVAGDMMKTVLGRHGADAVSIVVMISIFAALNGSILSGSRIPYALARDGYFFRQAAAIHPEYHTPAPAILMLTAWAALLVLSGQFRALYTLVLVPSWILYAMAAASVIILRRKRPDLERPYRTIGYPLVPIVFVAVAIVLLLSTLIDAPRESLLGLLIMAAGVPFYLHWRRRRED